MESNELIKYLERKALQLRYYILEMIGVGKAGHLGGSSSCAEIVATLYFHWMNIDPNNPYDPNRDRFLLSKGHAALVQYAALAELGYFPIEELKKVKTLGGMLQGHPDMKTTPGVEANTGSLGQGLSIALGMALGLRLDGRKSRVYVILGDGELAEGQVWEAAMAASHYKVDNLVAFVDKNGVQATGPVEERLNSNPLAPKWSAFGWHVIEIDGHSIKEILEALKEANNIKGRPTVIIAHTVKGKGFSFAEHNAAFHNGILTEEQYLIAKRELEKLMQGDER
ncbi:transketolase [Caldicoprobacter guelmensis]|uniref:transketolase n=1 Tax=Caldicoprobacter guelmensis TaxID=1170224 RepID=UPI00195D82AB|nr:transketolase [Caldicoprobacter guelmensis]MBM7583404.1 transketolase [Caldicoprobacter guelmensis]